MESGSGIEYETCKGPVWMSVFSPASSIIAIKAQRDRYGDTLTDSRPAVGQAQI